MVAINHLVEVTKIGTAVFDPGSQCLLILSTKLCKGNANYHVTVGAVETDASFDGAGFEEFSNVRERWKNDAASDRVYA